MKDEEKIYQAYDVAKHEKHQFDLLFIPHNVSDGNTYKYILTSIDLASRYKVARPLRTKKSSKVAFILEAIYKKCGVFKYPKVFQCDNVPEFKNEVTKLLENHIADIQWATYVLPYTSTLNRETISSILST